MIDARNVVVVDLASEAAVADAMRGILRVWGHDNPTRDQLALARAYALGALAGLSRGASTPVVTRLS